MSRKAPGRARARKAAQVDPPTPSAANGHPATPAAALPETRRIAELKLDPNNARTHDQKNHEAIRASLTRFGQVEPLVIQAGTDVVIGGNARLEVMRELGWEWAKVVVFTGDAATAKALSIALNRAGELAAWDEVELARQLKELEAAGMLAGVGFSEQDLETMLARNAPASGADDPGPIEIKPEVTTTIGDLWLLGDHRLLCGDCTDDDDLDRLLGNEKASLCITDPPYGVNFQDTAGKNIAADIGYDIIPKFFGKAVDRMLPGKAMLFFGAETNFGLWQALVGRELKSRVKLLIWRKSQFVLRHHDYHSQFECIYYCWTSGGGTKSRWLGDRNQTDVWDVVRDVSHQEQIHPTQKPVELFEIAMRNHTSMHDICFEPFSGSGSQLIACEKMNRWCRAVEIAPQFVDAAIRRWQQATGKKAVLAEDGTPFDDIKPRDPKKSAPKAKSARSRKKKATV